MKTDKVAGLILIVGSVGFVATMAIHPTGGSLEKIIQQARLNIGAHALAITSMGLLLAGFLRLARALRPERPWADIGLVAFAFAAGAGTLDAICNSLVIQALAERTAAADSDAKPMWRAILLYNHLLSAALTQVLIAAAALSVLVWSLSLLRVGQSWTILGTAGLAVGLVSLFMLFSGRIRNNVHDFGLFVLGWAAWIIVLGAFLCRSKAARDTA